MTNIDEYKLKFLEEESAPAEEDEGRQETLNDLSAFIDLMCGRPLASVTLDVNQSTQWDETEGFDYQNHYGQEIIGQVSADGETETLVIHNAVFLPVAMAVRAENGAWQGIGVDERLREIVAKMLEERLS